MPAKGGTPAVGVPPLGGVCQCLWNYFVLKASHFLFRSEQFA